MKSDTMNNKVIQITAEDFVNELIDSVRTNTKEEFHRRFIEAEKLTILDFDFLTNREVSMEEYEKIRRAREKYGRRMILR